MELLKWDHQQYADHSYMIFIISVYFNNTNTFCGKNETKQNKENAPEQGQKFTFPVRGNISYL